MNQYCWHHHQKVDSDPELLENVFRGHFGGTHCDALREESKKHAKRVERSSN